MGILKKKLFSNVTIVIITMIFIYILRDKFYHTLNNLN